MRRSIPGVKKLLLESLLEDGPKLTIQLAGAVGVHWNTAEKYLLKLAAEGMVEKDKKWGRNLWFLKK